MIAVRGAGQVFDQTGNCDRMFVTFMGVLVIAAVIVLATNRVDHSGAPRSA